jgi:hypothetical protein
MMGNHDHYVGAAADSNYLLLGQPLHQYVVIKNTPFITISMSATRNNGPNLYNAEAKSFLTTHLARANREYPDKPIFVFAHVAPSNTMYGTGADDGNWGTDDLTAILKPYPQVIIFTGHSHYPLADPRSIHQGDFTSINDGSTTYSEVEPGVVTAGIHPEKYAYVTEGLIVNSNAAGDVELERWDTYRDEEILPRWVVRAPHDGSQFVYKHRDGLPVPSFPKGSQVTVSNVTDTLCTVTFPQALDNENVHHYRIEAIEGTAVVSTFSKFSEFYLNSEAPTHFVLSIGGLPADSHLRVRVTAIDSYNNKSEAIVSKVFKTLSMP